MLAKWTAGLLVSAVAVAAVLWLGAGVESASSQDPSTATEGQDPAEMTEPYTATVEKPAVLPLPTNAAAAATAGKADFVVVNVLGFTPPAEGSVSAQVKMRDASGTEQVLGNFGLYPSDTQFQAATPGDVQRFLFRLPAKVLSPTGNAAAQIIVDLVPASGDAGKGAVLELGGLEVKQQ